MKSHLLEAEAQYESRVEMLTDPHLSKLLHLLANMGLRLEIAVKESFAA
ncbi:MAG: hypothetical protein RBT80_13450 [Candidatus Vecturithrix sp.]|jgi:hypothetical protein|nr:hypothetical protein [Candidatus Vecturithrix sp.]